MTVVLSESFDTAVPPTEPAGGEEPAGASRGHDPAPVPRSTRSSPFAASPPSSGAFPGVEFPTLKTDFAPEQARRFVEAPPGRYVHLRMLLARGDREVQLVRDENLGREVVLEELRGDVLDAAGSGPAVMGRTPAELRFVNEVRTRGQLDHPGIAPVFELGRWRDARLYYTTRLPQGRTLATALAQCVRQERLALLPQFVDVCQAVAYAHARGIVHGGLDPDHIMLGDFGETVVTGWDLGGAPEVGAGNERQARNPSDASLDTSGEQDRGELDLPDQRSDVSSLGAILYRLLEEDPPLAHGTTAEVVRALEGEATPQVSEAIRPKELAAVVRRALEKRPERRYASALDLAADVNAFLAGSLAGTDQPRRPPVGPWVRGLAVALWGAVGLLLVVGAAWWYRDVTQRQAEVGVEAQRQADVSAEVDRLLVSASAGDGGENWLDLHSSRLISMREPLVEVRLIAALDHPQPSVRRLAARALGGMGAAKALEPLLARLQPGVEPVADVTTEVIKALAVIGDPRADAPVAAARGRAGPHSALWKQTALAYAMLPLPPLPEPPGELTAAQWKQRATALQEKGREREAVAALTRALALAPDDASAYSSRASASMAMGDDQLALADLDRALALDPALLSAANNRALVRKRLEDYAGALEDFDRLVAAGERGAAPLRNRARVRIALGDLPGALADFEAARVQEPDNPLNFAGEGEVWLVQNDMARAVTAFSGALALNRKYPRALVRRATAHHELGDVDAARHDLEWAVALEPQQVEAAGHLALLMVGDGEIGAAQRVLDRVVAVAPRQASAHAVRGVVLHLSRGQLQMALVDLERACELETDPVLAVEYRLFRAAAHLGIGQRGAAQRAIEGLQSSPAPRWDAVLGALVQRRLTIEEARQHAFTPDRRCALYLAAGLGAELNRDEAKARSAYAHTQKLRRSANLSCVVARHELHRLTHTGG